MRCYMILCCVFLTVLAPTLSRAQETFPTIAERIATDDDLTTLQQLLDATDPQIRGWLENPDSEFTVFAPSNEAWELFFDDLGVTAEEYMQRSTSLEEKLRLLIIPMTLVARQEDENAFVPCFTLGSMLPDVPNFIEWEIGGFEVNLETVSSDPVMAENGLIYVIDQVLPEMSLGRSGDHTPDDIATATPAPRPPRRPLSVDSDILTTLAQDGRFTVLLHLLSEYPPYQNRLSGDSLYMLFAPTDAAFEEYFADNSPLTSTAFEQDSGEIFLSYNLVPGYLTPNVFFDMYTSTNSQFCTFLRGEAVEFSEENGTAFIGDAPLSGEALPARNGVIYITEAIHLPPFRG